MSSRSAPARALVLPLFVSTTNLMVPPETETPISDETGRFLAPDFGVTLTTSGDPRTGPVLEALKDQRLLYSAETKRVFIKDKSDKLTDAATGEPVAAPPADTANVRLNNRVRGMLDAALGSLTLMANEPGRRFDAAQAVFKSRDAGALPNIDKALEKETDTRVRKALTEARAAILLTSAGISPEDKIAAIAVIRDRGDQDALALVDGLPADLPPAVRQAEDGWTLETIDGSIVAQFEHTLVITRGGPLVLTR